MLISFLAVGVVAWFFLEKNSEPKKTVSIQQGNVPNLGKRGDTCTLGNGLKGDEYIVAGGDYLICFPNGMELQVSYDKAKNEGYFFGGHDINSQSPYRLHTVTGGEGPHTFEAYYGRKTPLSNRDLDYQEIGKITAKNISGTIYQYIQKEDDTREGLGGISKGSIMTLFYFEKGNDAISINGNYLANQSLENQTATVEEIAKSLTVNF